MPVRACRQMRAPPAGAGEGGCVARAARGVLGSQRPLTHPWRHMMQPLGAGECTAPTARSVLAPCDCDRAGGDLVQPFCAARRQRGWGGRLQSADGKRSARLARPRRASGGTRCCLAARPSTSAAGEGGGRAPTACGMLVSRDRDLPAAAPSVAPRRGPPPAQLGRAPVERRWRAA